MKAIAILGGAFDPVTVGHLGIIRTVENLGFEVICMPCGDRHFFGKKMLSAKQRVKMLRLAVRANAICQIEIEQGTYRAADTYPLLTRRYGPVHWIIGGDNANSMDRWGDGDRLKETIPFVVIAREGHPLQNEGVWCLKPPHRYVSAQSTKDVSSTIARTAIARRDWAKAKAIVPPEILKLIRANNWYASQAATNVRIEAPLAFSAKSICRRVSNF